MLEKITAHPNFFILATMNPGGDYGKKELSPALRNRFTEIWVSSVSDADDLRHIARERYAYPFSGRIYLMSPWSITRSLIFYYSHHSFLF